MTPELLAARERLLEGIMATWSQSARQPRQVPRTLPPLPTIDTAAETASVERLRRQWADALAAKQAMVDAGTALPNNYWLDEARARARYVAAVHILEVLGG